ncbi:MAG: hypothetical protein JWQ71_1798 [Pedosphaera sp.]|nr:hypothetical protein [Pedosphaera sp.]
MKYFNRWFVPAALALLSACSFHQVPMAVLPVGPAPREEIKSSNEGFLMVYSAWSLFNDYPSSTDHHSRYTITSDDGKLNKEVQNHIDRFDEGPIRLPLTPGSYKVSARSAHSGRVVVPVIIKERQTTVVYLDGSSPSDVVQAHAANMVKLPNGQIVGWSAEPPVK